jgi:TolB protein
MMILRHHEANSYRRLPHLTAALFLLVSTAQAAQIGVFENTGDIGQPAKPGSVTFNPADSSYVIAGGGSNMWFTNDSFRFVWKKVSGDFALRSAIEWTTNQGNAHRKACLLVRQSLDPESAYLDIAVHGDGLTSLQFRETTGGLTHEIQSIQKAPARVSLNRQGDTFFMAGAARGETLRVTGPFMRLKLLDPVYVGMGVCAHDDAALEKATFSQVELQETAAKPEVKPVLHCTLETVPIGSKDRRAVYHTTDHIEAPNWSKDGRSLIFNSSGHLYRIPAEGGIPEWIDTGFAVKCNNDHGISPDGRLLAISDQTQGGKSMIYTVAATGGAPKQITPLGPSYWHGWSPDGKTLAYCAERNGEFDIYTMNTDGSGEEKRLTTAKGLDDGPDYTPDGKYIYFNSERSGSMQIWRMSPDGTGQEQVSNDDDNNWFAHPSPDGKWIVYLAYEKGVTGHPANQSVVLKLMPAGGGPIQELARLFGGQGTINVPSWSPDSRQVAFVSYEMLKP